MIKFSLPFLRRKETGVSSLLPPRASDFYNLVSEIAKFEHEFALYSAEVEHLRSFLPVPLFRARQEELAEKFRAKHIHAHSAAFRAWYGACCHLPSWASPPRSLVSWWRSYAAE